MSSASTVWSLRSMSGLSPKPRRSTSSSRNLPASGRCSAKHSVPQLIVPCTSTARGAPGVASSHTVT